MILKEIRYLLKKEIMLEWRQKFALNGIILYVVSTVFVAYLSFKNLSEVNTWNALFWIIILFASVNAVAKSFLQESRQRHLYYYQLASPQAVILSKIIYNCLLLSIVALTTFFIYSLFIGSPVKNNLMFMSGLLIGSFGFASLLTLISAIASKTGGNTGLMAILSFPVILPFILTLLRFSENAANDAQFSLSYQLLLILVAINVTVIMLSFVLFPYIWRD